MKQTLTFVLYPQHTLLNEWRDPVLIDVELLQGGFGLLLGGRRRVWLFLVLLLLGRGKKEKTLLLLSSLYAVKVRRHRRSVVVDPRNVVHALLISLVNFMRDGMQSLALRKCTCAVFFFRLRITLKSTVESLLTLVHVRSRYAWTRKSWQRS